MTTYQHIFPTCIAADINTEFVETLTNVGDEYLKLYGSSSQPFENHLTTYHNKKSAEMLMKDGRLLPFYDYIKKEARLYLNAMNLDDSKYKFENPFSFFAKVGDASKHDLHAHPGSVISGVYYLKVGENTPPIIFKDPREYYKYIHYKQIFGNNSAYTLLPEHAVPVHDGLIMMWPSWLEHEVPLSSSDGERITIAFNLDK